MEGIRSKLFKVDPYLNFDASRHQADMQGWGSEHPFFDAIIRFIKPSTIVEVGTWKGGSAIHMAKICQNVGLRTEIVCIDTWLGSAEHFLDRDTHDSLLYRNGYPQIYTTFLTNVVSAGLADVITPFPMASESAGPVLASLGVRPELIYIDAAHQYDAVYRDASLFWPLLSDNGIMIFDDYGYSDVTSAACAFAAAQKKALYASYSKAFIVKGIHKPSLNLVWM